MDPVTTATAASVIKAGSSIWSGYNRASELKQQAYDAQIRAEQIKTQQKQDSASRFDELSNALQTITALSASRSIGIDSPTALAFEKGVNKKAIRGMEIANTGYIAEQDSLKRSAKSARKAASNSIIAGYVNAVPSLLDAYGSMNSPK